MASPVARRLSPVLQMRRAIFISAAAIGFFSFSYAERKDIRLDNNRFSPSIITARAGDTLVFVTGRGGPHNVQFADDSISDHVHQLIDAAMPDRPRVKWSREVSLAGPLLLDGETYTVVVPPLPPGRYRFFCTPHLTGGMRGELVIEN